MLCRTHTTLYVLRANILRLARFQRILKDHRFIVKNLKSRLPLKHTEGHGYSLTLKM